jgi:predicted dehydrogenase
LFIEKTLASDFAQARELCELATVKGGVNMVGYMKRFSVTFNKAKELVDEAILDNLPSFEAYASPSDFVSARTRYIGILYCQDPERKSCDSQQGIEITRG